MKNTVKLILEAFYNNLLMIAAVISLFIAVLGFDEDTTVKVLLIAVVCMLGQIEINTRKRKRD